MRFLFQTFILVFVCCRYANATTKKKVMIVHTGVLASTRGGDMHVYTTIEALVKLDYEVTFWSWTLNWRQREVIDLSTLGVEVTIGSPHRLRLLLITKQIHYDAAIEFVWNNVDYLRHLRFINDVLKSISHETAIIAIYPDILHQRVQKEHLARKRPCKHCKDYKEIETYFARFAEVVVGVDVEINRATKLLWENATVFHLPYAQADISLPDIPFHNRSGITYFGAHIFANTLSVSWLLKEVTPQLYQKYNAVLDIYGKVTSKKCNMENYCKHHGKKEKKDLHEAILRSRWMVAPIFTLVGVSTKIVKALAVGTPVITTPYGLGGMEHIKEPLPMVVVNVSEFAATVLSAYGDEELWMAKQRLAKPFISRHFGMVKLIADTQKVMTLAREVTLANHIYTGGTINTRRNLTVVWEVPPRDDSTISSIYELFPHLQRNFNNIIITTKDCADISATDVYIRLSYAPDLNRPSCCPTKLCKYIVYLPYDFGYLPVKWVTQINLNVDRLWTVSSYHTSMFQSSGVKPSIIRTMPYGVDCIPSSAQSPSSVRDTLGIGKTSFLFGYSSTGVDTYAAEVIIKVFEERYSSGKNDGAFLLVLVPEKCAHLLKSKCLNIKIADIKLFSLSEFFGSIDAYVNPVGSEWNLQVIQAVAHGAPLLACWGVLNDYLSLSHHLPMSTWNVPWLRFPSKPDRAFCVQSSSNSNKQELACEKLVSDPVLLSAGVGHKDLLYQLSEAKYALRRDGSTTFHSKYVCDNFQWMRTSVLFIDEIYKCAASRAHSTSQVTSWGDDALAPAALRMSSPLFFFG